MRVVIQRVARAKVETGGQTLGAIGKGLLILLGVEKGDTLKDGEYLCDKIVNLRIFEDEAGKMNLSLLDIGGEALMISQFTLLGDARHGRRPGFTDAELPEKAEPLYEAALQRLAGYGLRVQKGRFGADMQVELVNDGPVTLLLDSKKKF
ncbi:MULTISPECIES: D-aminoacyl-tRNA deacylase [unclassified Clostridium]|uniref:D-aminoacyl-tRNA deacylase n=1 Tax=unclassified Clostridium TaxID=2614128 RepID=UPI00110613C4|nr:MULTISPECIES: D-aminoacyl-tRNA deacylase [unclassified Clostridium]